MASTTANTTAEIKFRRDFFVEFIRNSRYSKFTKNNSNAPITIKEGRQIIDIPLVTRLKANAITGSNTLRGNEEALQSHSDQLTPTYKRNAVTLTNEEREKPAIDLMRAARSALMEWAKEEIRDDISLALGAIDDGTTYNNFADADETLKDSWLSNNSDRVLFGAAKSNNSSNDHSASLSNVDSTTDVLSDGIVSLAKRIAQTADPHIRPIKVNDDEEWFVLFTPSRAFRDFSNDATIQQANRDARMRSVETNPLFTGGDLVWDGVIIREVPELTALSSVGANTIDVDPCYLCGVQAVGYGLGQRPKLIVDNDFDYKFQPGVAVEFKEQIRKLMYNSKQHGMVTVYVSGVADA